MSSSIVKIGTNENVITTFMCAYFRSLHNHNDIFIKTGTFGPMGLTVPGDSLSDRNPFDELEGFHSYYQYFDKPFDL